MEVGMVRLTNMYVGFAVCLASVANLHAGNDVPPTDITVEEPSTAVSKNEADKQLQIKRFCLAYTALGPERIRSTVQPGEIVFAHAQITGVLQNAEGQSEVSM